MDIFDLAKKVDDLKEQVQAIIIEQDGVYRELTDANDVMGYEIDELKKRVDALEKKTKLRVA